MDYELPTDDTGQTSISCTIVSSGIFPASNNSKDGYAALSFPRHQASLCVQHVFVVNS